MNVFCHSTVLLLAILLYVSLPRAFRSDICKNLRMLHAIRPLCRLWVRIVKKALIHGFSHHSEVKSV